MRCPRCKRRTDRPKRENCRVCVGCSSGLNDHVAWLVGTLVLSAVHARERDIRDVVDATNHYIHEQRDYLDHSVLNAARWFMGRWEDGRVPEALVLWEAR